MFTAIVTGGAQGIGKAISLKLISEGVFVFLIDNDQEALSDFEAENKGKAMSNTIHCDVSNEKLLERTLKSIAQQRPSLKYLVNNAGVSTFKPLQELSLDEWNHILAVNLTSYFITAKTLAFNLINNTGSVVNLCSTRAIMSEPNSEAYAASKGGVSSLTHALAISLQPDVRVNSISPGWIDVAPWQKKSQRKTTIWAEKHHSQHPVGRIGRPEDVAELCWFLLSDKAEFITGQNYVIDGGITKKMIYESE
jgi:NAD(P)-dependent dehydrogenase (short-subunit alcohol dehydrogenase family)